MNHFIKSIKCLCLIAIFILLSFTSKAQTTYYFIANGANPGNITNTVSVSGVTYWRHLTTTPGSTVGLVPASVSLAGMGNDDFIVDNSSFSYTVATAYQIIFNTNITLKNINTTAFTGGFGGFTQLTRIGFGFSSSTTTIKKDISMTTSTKLGYVQINNILEIDPNAGQTSNLLFGQRPVQIDTRLLLRGSGGIINFNDSLITHAAGGGNITIQSNTPLDATNSFVNFNEGVLLNTAGGMVINRGWVNFYKNVCNRNLGVQTTASGIQYVRKSVITIGSTTNGGYTHVMLNKTGISQNKFSRIGFIFVNGYANFTNVLSDSSSLWSSTVNKVFPGGPTAPSAPIDTFLTAANTHFNFLNSNYGNDQIALDWRTAAILRGTYKFYAMPASGASQGTQNNVYARMNYATFKDSVHFRCNAQINCNQGSALGATFANFNSIIDTNAVMVLDKGFIYDLTNPNYASGSFATNLLNIKGKLVVGGTSSCGSGGLTILKYGDINFNFGAGTPHLADIQNTQLISTRARPSLPATFVSINANNTDMGGNQGWGIGGIAYGTAPYNTIPYTGTSPRSLIWNNAISGATFWNEAKWYNEADGDNVYDDCPPTYIDSVTVRPSSSLSIDVRFAQCKTLYFQGATSMLTSKRTQASDSLNTLEIFGSLIIDNQLNNRFYRNIHFKAWQSYPIIKTSGTFFHRGLAFRSLNSAPTTTLEINRGVWTLQDTLNAYSSAETFTTAPAPAAPGTKYIINRKFYGMIDGLTYWPNGYNCSVSITDQSFLLMAGKLNTNGYNVNCNDFSMAYENTLVGIGSNSTTKSLDMGWKPSGTPGINRKTTFNIYHTHNCNTSPTNWYVSAENGRTTLFADSSHVRLHAPNSNIVTNASTDRRLHYWDITFMFSKPTIGANGAIGAWLGYDGTMMAGQTHARHVTFYGSDFSAAQTNVFLRNDTIRKLTFLDTRANTKTSFNVSSTGSTIDTLISNPPTSNIFGNNRIRKYLYFAPGSNNSLNTSTISVYQPTVTPRMVRDSLTHSYKIGWPYGAKIDFVNTCYVPGIITGGRIVTAGDAVPYPVPHHYNLPTPRDTFDIKYANISTNTLTASQTVDGSNTLNNTVNWIAGSTVPRCLYFRGNAPASGGNWADNNVWARVISYSPFTLGPVNECAPNCSDTVVFDNQSFLSPTHKCYFTSGASNYVGTFRWKAGAKGIFEASRLSQLTVCYSWDCEDGNVATGMDNQFLGRIIFTSPRPDAFIKTSNMTFSGPVEYISLAPTTGTLTLRDDISFKPLKFDNTGLPWAYTQCYNLSNIGLYIVAGTFDSQSKAINAGMFQSISSSVRAIYLRNSTLNLVSGSGGNHGGYMLGGTMANLTHHAESAIINISGGAGGNCYYGLYTWLNNSLANSYLGGYKFKTVNINSTTGCTGVCYSLGVSIRNDTIADTLKINGNVNFFEAYRRSSINKLLWTNTNGSLMGNANTFASRNAFIGLRINEFTFTSPPGTIVPLRWDSIFVKDKYSIIAPGATIFHTTGGVTHFGNKCQVLVEGSSSGTLLLDATPNTKAYPTYNIPGSATYATAEHYYRKDSGTVCTEHTNIKNLWAIGNGNVFSSPTHGTWAVPNPSPTPHYSLIDTTQGSSYYTGTPIPLGPNYNRTTNPIAYTTNVPLAGRARFYVGQNATLVSNAKGWDDNKFPPVPSLTISTTTITVCQTQTVSLYFTGISGIPFNLVYENTNSPNKDTIKITSTSQLDNYNDATNAFTVTTVVSPTTSTNYFLGYVITDRCTNNVSAQGTGTTSVIVNPIPSAILATSSPTTICNAVPFNLNANATAGQTYTLFPTPTGTNTPTPMTSYTVGAAVNGSVTIPAGTYTAGSVPETYTVYAAATTSLGCISLTRTPVQIIVNPTPSVAITSQTNVACFGQATGAVSYSATGGSGGGYSINPSITGLIAGAYNYTVTDANGCATNTTATITQPASALTAIASGTNNTNCITADGQVSTTPSGGTSGYNYLWSTGASTLQTVTGLTGGTYTVTVTDNNNCTYTTQATIANPSAPVITATSNTNTICNGNSVTFTPSGGATTYSIIPSTGTATTGVTGATVITPTATTSYSVVGTNSTSCLSNTVTLNVTVNATPVVTIAATSNTICNGQSTALNLTGASTYTLVNTNSPITSGTSFSPSADVTYTVIGSTAGCASANTQQLITVNALPVVTATTNAASICSGNTATLTAAGADTYTWTSGPIAATHTVNATGTYTVTGTNTVTGCANTSNVSLVVNPLPVVTATSNSATICSGNTATLTAGGAQTYTWTSPASTNTVITVTPTTATIYTVTGTDANNCVNSRTVSVGVNATPTVAITAANNTICIGNSSALTLAGASTYTLLNDNTPITSGASVSPTTTTTYSIQGSTGTCTSSATQQVITVNALPVVTATTSAAAICSGNTATLTAGGASTYTWASPSSTNTVITVNATGNYVVTGTDANNCVNTATVNLTVNPTPTVSISASSGTICSGQTATLTAATANTYVWSTTSTASTSTVMPTGTTVYTVTGTNTAGSCTATAQFTVNVNPKPDMALTNTTSIVCLGDVNGTATVNTTNGTSGYTYVWSGSASTSSVATNLAAGSQTAIVTDARGCKDTLVVAIAAPSASLATAIATETTGCSLSNGTATVTATGGWNPGYTYVWQANASTTNTATGYAAGTYTAQVTDANGCVKVQNFTISNPTTPTIAAVASNPSICSGLSTTITPSGAVSYSITGGAVSSSTVGTSFTVNPTANTTYSIIGTDASNCISTTATVSINVNTTPTVNIAASNNTICIGNSSALTLTGASTYTLLNDNTTITSGSIVSPTTTTTYSIQGTTGICTSSATQQVITVNTLPVITATTSAAAICSGNTATLTAAGANTYTWSGGPTSDTYTVNATNAYVVTGTDANNCVNTATVNLTVNPTPTVAIAASSGTICSGQTTTLTAATADGYNWSSGEVVNAITVAPTSNTVYTVIGTNTAGTCTASAQYSVMVNATPTVAITASNNTICIGNSSALTLAGATTYTLLNDNTTITSGASVSPTTTTTYSIQGSTGTCTSSATQQVINVNPLPVVTASSNSSVICSGNTATLTAGGANTYTWTSPSTTSSVITVNPSTSTNYVVTGTDANNCVNTATVNLTVNPTPTVAISASSGTICSGQTTTLTAATANDYSWSSGQSVNAISVAPTTNTVYTVIGTNTAGTCTASAQYSVMVNALPVVTATTSSAAICANQTATLTAGGASTYTWTNPASTNTVITVNASNAYVVTGTDGNGCVNTATVNLTVNPLPTVTAVSNTTAVCVNQSATLTAGGAQTYTWTSPASTNTVITVNPNTTTDYVVTGTDANNCINTQTVTLTVNQLPTLTASTITNVTCFGANNGSVVFTPAAGTPAYAITGTSVTGTSATGLAPADYTYTVTDAAGCQNTTTLSITQPTAALAANAAVTATNSSCTNPNGAFAITATGGTSTYSYSIDGGALTTNNVTTNLSSGPHTYVVTDANGCVTATGTVNISGTPGITSSVANQLNVLCYGNNTASVTVTGAGGSAYDYTLTPITATTSVQTNTTGNFTGLSAGTYSVLVVDQMSNCISTNTITINTPTAALALTGITANSVVCNGGTAQVTTTVTGGTTPYTYVWSAANTSTTSSASYTAGNYNVTITDFNGCALATQNFTIHEAPVLTIASVATTTTGCGLSNASATVTANGGWSSNSYTITGTTGVVSNTNTASNLVAGTYSANIVDALGCTTQTVFTISNPTTPTLNIASATPAICAGQTATLTPTGAVSYTLASTSGTFVTSTTVTPVSTTVYNITGTDASNCTSAPLSVTVTVNELPTLSLASSNAAICLGQTATLTASTTGTTTADTYTWSTGVSSTNTETVSPIAQTVYTVAGTNNATGCVSAVQSVTVDVNALPTAAVASQTNITCLGDVNGSVVLSSSSTNTTVVESTTNLAAGNYTFTITDLTTTCSNTVTATIAAPTASLAIASIATQTAACATANGSATITAVDGWGSPYTYSVNGTVVTGSVVTGLQANNYTAEVSDVLGCVNSLTFAIVNPNAPTLSIVSNTAAICVGNSVTLTPTGAASYTITSPSVTFTTDVAVNPTITTVYNIIGTDLANCTSAPLTVTVNVNALPTISISATSSTICAGQTATLTANGADTYVWSSSANTTSTEVVNPSAQTVYTAQGTNTVTGCTSNVAASFTVDVNALPTAAVASQTNVTCLGDANGIVVLNSSSTNTTVVEPTTNLAAGDYTFTIVDNTTTCTNTVSATIVAPTASLAISSVVTQTAACATANGSATITAVDGWGAPYTYSVNGTATTGSVVTGLQANNYTAQVSDAMGCLSTTTFTIVNPNAPVLSIASNTAVICAGNSVTLTPTGATNYTLGTTTFTNNIVLNPTTTTVVTITGTDASSCTSAPITVTVNVNALPTISISATSSTICAGQTTTLTATGADTYVWSSSANTTSTEVVNPSAQTIYTAQGTNTLTGCTSSVAASFTVDVNAIPTASVTSQSNVLCFGQSNGSVTLTTTPSSAVVSPVTTTSLSGGVHTFTITNNGCESVTTVTITSPTVALTAVVNNTTTNTSCATPNGAFTVTASGGTPSYTYNATNTTGIFVNQGTGTQNITITDANGCTYTVSATIQGVPTPSISSATQTNVLCNGQATGAAAVTITGGTPTYTYTWSNNAGLNSNTQANLPAGSYTVTATDAGSCTVTQAFVITEPNALDVLTTNVVGPCVGQANGAISIEITGGTPNYNIVWNPSSTVENTSNTSTISNIGEGTYVVVVTDANGCNFQRSIGFNSINDFSCSFVIPEIFSPNGDGKNDTWEIKGLENYPNNNVTVFNRWGDQVFKAEPYQNDWDGTNTGDKSILGKGALPVGTYYFILDLGNGDKPITGYVQLTK